MNKWILSNCIRKKRRRKTNWHKKYKKWKIL